MDISDEFFENKFTEFEELKPEEQKLIINKTIKKISEVKKAISCADIDKEIKSNKPFSKNSSLLIWQFLRFNASYVSDYSKFKKGLLSNKYAKKRWLISRFVNPEEHIPIKEFKCLKYRRFEILDDVLNYKTETIYDLLEINKSINKTKKRSNIDTHVFVMRIDSGVDLKSLFDDLKKMESKLKSRKKYAYNLLDIKVINFLIYHAKRRYGLSDELSIEIHAKILGRDVKKIDATRFNKEKRVIQEYLKLSNQAPFVFY